MSKTDPTAGLDRHLERMSGHDPNEPLFGDCPYCEYEGTVDPFNGECHRCGRFTYYEQEELEAT